MSYKSAYLAFDIYPSAKGAATHIEKFSKTLFDEYDKGLLLCLASNDMPLSEKHKNYDIIRMPANEPNYLKRSEKFIDFVKNNLTNKNIDICHYRDIWSCLGVADANINAVKIFEINGLPSIELNEKYILSKDTVKKLQNLERFCAEISDFIITPSFTTKKYITENLGSDQNKISVITNAAYLPENTERTPDMPEKYIIYFGAVQTWQGLDVLLKAFHQLRDIQDLQLVVISSNREKVLKEYHKISKRLQIESRIKWLYMLDKPLLQKWITNARVSVVPLKNTKRNIVQGCSPLKIFESMACKTPIVASDIAAVREILTDNQTAKLVYPDRPQELAMAIRLVLQEKDFAEKIATNAFNLLKNKYLWEYKISELKNFYKKTLKLKKQWLNAK